jgi:hypothetical protein
MGEHEEYKIGRVLRSITFTGKGFVDKPANVDSIIFTKKLIEEPVHADIVQNNDKKNSDFIFSGVSNIQSTLNVENNIMSSNEIKEEVVANVVETTETQNDVSTEATPDTSSEVVANVELETLSQKILELETQVIAQQETINTLQTEKEEAAKKAKMPKEDEDAKDEENKNLKAELNAANETIAAYKKKEQDMAKMEKRMKRKASLVDNGLDSDTADTVVDKFETMADDAFETMTSLFAGKMPPWLEKIKKGDKDEEDKKTKEKKKASENSADPAVLDTVEVVEDVNLSVGGEVESEITSTRAALVDFVYSRLGRKNT